MWKKLRTRNLSDMNDLYNAQDVILLCEIIEYRFQLMQDKYDFNPRKCNSASTLSGSIERDLSKIIISLPTNNEHVELFEKTLTGGFSCVNTRLPFDTELLLPNVEKPDQDNWKDYSYVLQQKHTQHYFQKKLEHLNPLYLEHLKKSIGRAGWKVTKIYAHYTFEQERLKKKFILMN